MFLKGGHYKLFSMSSKAVFPVVFLLLSLVLSTQYPSMEQVDIAATGVFREDEDNRWRCYANIIITNHNEENITLLWIYVNALNITYVDESSSELGISENHTANRVLQPKESIIMNFMITTLGFDKEPEILWVTLKASFLELETPTILTTTIRTLPTLSYRPYVEETRMLEIKSDGEAKCSWIIHVTNTLDKTMHISWDGIIIRSIRNYVNESMVISDNMRTQFSYNVVQRDDIYEIHCKSFDNFFNP